MVDVVIPQSQVPTAQASLEEQLKELLEAGEVAPDPGPDPEP